MITISIQILSQDMAGGKSEKEQLAAALGALGFERFADHRRDESPVGYDDVDVERTFPVKPDTTPKTRGRPKKEADKPDAPADPAPSEAAQDAADEKAEQEAAKPAPEPEKATVYGQEDMRAAGKAYADAYGMEACLEDIPAIIGYAAFKLVPEDKFDEVTRAVQAAVAANPNNRTKKA